MEHICHSGNPVPTVKAVTATPDYMLHLTFGNGETRIYDARPLLTKNIFLPLQEPAFFLRAFADGCSVAWNDDIDLDPCHLYECSTPTGGATDV
jgi:hypothetical protein